jgi:hypothetical protein
MFCASAETGDGGSQAAAWAEAGAQAAAEVASAGRKFERRVGG